MPAITGELYGKFVCSLAQKDNGDNENALYCMYGTNGNPAQASIDAAKDDERKGVTLPQIQVPQCYALVSHHFPYHNPQIQYS